MRVFSTLLNTCRHLLLMSTCVAANGVLASSTEDLLQIFQKARRNDPALEAARRALDIANEKIPQARAAMLPSMALNGNRDHARGNASFSTINPPQWDPATLRSVRSSQWTVQLTQPLIRRGSWESYSQAEFLFAQAQAQFIQAEQDLVLRVAQAYFDYDLTRSGTEVANLQVHSLNEHLKQTQRSYELGVKPVTDVYESRSRAMMALSQQISARNEYENKRAALRKIIGESPAHLRQLRTGLPTSMPNPANVDFWIEQAMAHAPGIIAHQAALSAAEREIEKQRSEHFLSMDLSASYGKTYSSGSLTTAFDTPSRIASNQIGLRVTLPLYAGGGIDSRVREAVGNYQKLTAELELVKRDVVLNVQEAYSGIVTGIAAVAALKVSVQSGEDALTANRAGYLRGLRANIDVLNAELQLYAARRDLLKAHHNTLIHSLKLKLATGSLTENEIIVLNALLE